MSEDHVEGEADYSKGGRWNRLRNKLLPSRNQSDEDTRDSRLDDLSDFLPPQRPSQENKRPLGPKLDISSASKWPQAADVLQLKRAQPPDEDLPPFRYQKPRRRPGLTVGFVEDYADVIGTGGEDSEEPVTAIARRKQHTKRPSATRPRQGPSPDHSRFEGSPSGHDQSHAPRSGSKAQDVNHSSPADQHVRSVHERRRDLRKASPGQTPGEPYPTDGEHSPPRQRDYFDYGGGGSRQNDPKVLTRSRAHSDAPSLTVSGPEYTRPPEHARVFDGPPVLPVLRPEGSGSFLSAGDLVVVRPERRGSNNMEQRRAAEVGPYHQMRAESDVGQRSRETSPDEGSRPSTGGSHDPGVFQAPQYPTALYAMPSRTRNGRRPPDSTGSNQHQLPYDDEPGVRPPSPPAVDTQQYALPVRQHSRPHEHRRQPSDTLYPPHPLTSKATSRPASPYSQSSRSDHSGGSPRAPSSIKQQHQTDFSASGKRCIFKCNLHSFTIDVPSANDTEASHSLAQLPHWRRLQVFETAPEPGSCETTPGIAVIIFDSQTSYTDSAMQWQRFRLELSSTASQVHKLTVLSDPSPLRKIRLRSSAAPDMREQARAQWTAECSDIVCTRESLQSFSFRSLADLADFYKAVTGLSMTYTGTAHVKPPKKHGLLVRQLREHAAIAQVCLMSRKGQTMRLAAFLEDSRTLSVELHAWDTFEEAELKGTAAAIKLVGVKSCFADRWVVGDDERPETDVEDQKNVVGRSFLPLDMQMQPDLSEDITIAFEDEEEKRRFSMALPSEVVKPKGFTLMRRI